MAYNQISCTTSYGRTGLACGTEGLGYFQKIIWTTEDFEFASQSDAEDQSKWEDAINSLNVFPFKNFVMVEPGNEDDVREELSTGVTLDVRDGKMRETGYSIMAICEMVEHRKFNNKTGRLFLVTSNGYLLGYSPDGEKLKGFTLDTLKVGLMGGTDGSTVRKVPVYYSLAVPEEFGSYIGAIKPTWNPTDLEGLINVDIAISGSPTSSLVTFTVNSACDGEAVTGLVEGDFDFLKANGDAQETQTFAEVGSGVYKYTSSTAAVTGTIALKAPEDQTTGGYDDTGAVTVTIS